MKFTLDDNTVDDIVRQSLVEHAMFLLQEYNDPLEFIGTKAELFSALCTSIEYYSSREQWEDFKEMTRGKKVE